ncbi:MAG: TlpA disulfide reductase family protein [Mucilaginibacter sp.]|uniref:TlpA family protein disulfide reductase n=1 Tax=Mucilaginibacter sp. TaxID=1882438 RepID=UPI0032646159
MQKIILTLVLATLCLNFTANAQDKTTNINALKIGDIIPEAIWNMPLLVVNHPQGKKTITLNDYKGKLIILDFWDKYCGSCIAAMPRMAALQKQFEKELIIINVTTDRAEDAKKCLTTNKMLEPLNLSSVVEAKVLSQAFPHRTIPHYIWINKNKIFISQAAAGAILPMNVTKILRDSLPDWQEKVDIDTKKPLFLGDKVPSNVELTSYSIFIKGRVSGLFTGNGVTYGVSPQRDVFYSNQPLSIIYQRLAAKLIPHMGDEKIILELPKEDDFSDQGKRYTFQYVAPANQATFLFQNALSALNMASGYNGRIESRKTKYYTLIRTGNDDRLKSKGGEPVNRFDKDSSVLINCPLRFFIIHLNGDNLLGSFVLDKTGYTGKVDIILKNPLADVSSLNKELAAYGLLLATADEPVNRFVIYKYSSVSNTYHQKQ